MLLGSKIFISEVRPIEFTLLEFPNDVDNVWKSTEHNFSCFFFSQWLTYSKHRQQKK